MVTHSGGMLGVATDLILVPAEDLAVVVLTNGNGNGVGPAEDLLIRTILPKWKGIPDLPDPDPPPFKPTPELVGTGPAMCTPTSGTGRSACSSAPMGLSCSRLATRWLAS